MLDELMGVNTSVSKPGPRVSCIGASESLNSRETDLDAIYVIDGNTESAGHGALSYYGSFILRNT